MFNDTTIRVLISKNYDYVPLSFSSLHDPWWHSVHHRDTIVPYRASPYPTILEVTLENGLEQRGNGEWLFCHDDELWVTQAKNGIGTVTATGQDHNFYWMANLSFFARSCRKIFLACSRRDHSDCWYFQEY